MTTHSDRMSVLLVEDDPNTQSMFQLVMDHYDIHLTIAENEGTALAALASQSPDIIVLDIFLPDTDGYKILSEIRAMEPSPVCPIIATTAYYTTDSLPDMQQAGFDGYLLKPLDPAQIMPYIETLIRPAAQADL